jgi:hypothetical protein
VESSTTDRDWWVKYRDLVAGLAKSDRCDGLQQALAVS